MINAAHVKEALELISKGGANYSYFFDQLSSYEWIPALRENKFFLHPPRVIKEGDYLKFPNWPESQYLARVSSNTFEISRLIFNVIKAVPSTDNPRVHGDFVDAALKMSGSVAADISRLEREWIQSQNYLYVLLPKKYGQLISHLSSNGEHAEALLLAKTILRVQAPPESTSPVPNRRVIALMSEWDYQEILKDHIQDLIVNIGVEGFIWLGQTTLNAVDIEHGYKNDTNTNVLSSEIRDASYIWRPSVEDDGQREDFADTLFSTMRRAAIEILSRDANRLNEIIAVLEELNRPIFERLSIYLLTKFPSTNGELVKKRLLNKYLWDAKWGEIEFRELTKAAFGTLNPIDQDKVVRLLEEGPSRSLDPNLLKKWQLKRFSWIKEDLKGESKEIFNQLVKQLGEPVDAKPFKVETVWTGPKSPLNETDLEKMSTQELVEYLGHWEYAGEKPGPSKEGLGRTLTILVAKNPERFSSEAAFYKGLDPTYVRALLQGLVQAGREKKSFQWESVIELSEWVISQPRSIQGRNVDVAYMEADPDWGWSRRIICGVLSLGLELEELKLPFSYRTKIWGIIELLSDDPDPNAMDEKYDDTGSDPYTVSINSVRGEAIQAVILYALWVQKLLVQDNAREQLRTIDQVPEVKPVLDKHLDPKMEASLAIKSVYGRFFPWLTVIDTELAKQWVAKIFPEKDPHVWWAAWGAYMLYCEPYDNVFLPLKKEYEKAVSNIDKTPSWSRRPSDLAEHLAAHLMFFGVRGLLNFNEPLWKKFWESANEDLRLNALETIGRIIHDDEKNMPQEIINRLKEIWETGGERVHRKFQRTVAG